MNNNKLILKRLTYSLDYIKIHFGKGNVYDRDSLTEFKRVDEKLRETYNFDLNNHTFDELCTTYRNVLLDSGIPYAAVDYRLNRFKSTANKAKGTK